MTETLFVFVMCSVALGCGNESGGLADAEPGAVGDAEPGAVSDAEPGAVSDAEPGAVDSFDAERIACVDRINNFRASEGLSPLARWNAAESCSDQQSELDATDRVAHGNFGMCGEFAQNTCPNWNSVDAIVNGCLQSMWDEGPGTDFSKHGHYINMSSTMYTEVACGFFRGANGVWSNQNFR